MQVQILQSLSLYMYYFTRHILPKTAGDEDETVSNLDLLLAMIEQHKPAQPGGSQPYSPPNSPLVDNTCIIPPNVDQPHNSPNLPHIDQPYTPSNSPQVNQPPSLLSSPQQSSPSKNKADDSPPPLKRRKHDPETRNQAAYKLMLSLREKKREEKRARKRQSTSKQDQDEIVNIDCAWNVVDPPPKQTWIDSEIFTLSRSDKTIIESGNWLTDDIIDAGHKILAAQFKKRFGTAGFQSVILGRTFSFDVETKEFVQVLHDGINHWLLVSTVGATPSSIMVYDSICMHLPDKKQKDK